VGDKINTILIRGIRDIKFIARDIARLILISSCFVLSRISRQNENKISSYQYNIKIKIIKIIGLVKIIN